MKLIRCNDCKSMISIKELVFICQCGHCFCKQIMPTKEGKVIICGPCDVYAVKDSKLDEGMATIWRVNEPHPNILRVEKTEVKKVFEA